MSSRNLERLTHLVKSAAADSGAPGLAACARRGGEEIAAVAGVSSTGKGEPLSLDDRFPLSCGIKPLVALAVLYLAQSGRLDLDADLGEHLPELAGPGRGTGLTPRHLLSHTAGYVEPREPAARWSYSWERFAAFFPQRIQAFTPGAVWSYTHTGYALLGRLVEVVTGAPTETLLRDLMLAPLAIDFEAGPASGRDVALHVRSPRSGRFEPMRPPQDSGFLRHSISDRRVSVRDLIKIAGFMARGAPWACADLEAARQAMLAPVVPIPGAVGRKDAEHMPTAFGLGIGRYGGLHGVNGSFVGATCAMRFDSQTGAAAAVALNAWLPGARDKVVGALSGYITRPSEGSSPVGDAATAVDLPLLEGVYQGLMIGSGTVEIVRDGPAHLCTVTRLGAPSLTARLRRDADGGLEISDASSGFAIAALSQAQGGGPPGVMVGASAYVRTEPA